MTGPEWKLCQACGLRYSSSACPRCSAEGHSRSAAAPVAPPSGGARRRAWWIAGGLLALGAAAISVRLVAARSARAKLTGLSVEGRAQGSVTLDGRSFSLPVAYSIPDRRCVRDLHLLFAERRLPLDALEGELECYRHPHEPLAKLAARTGTAFLWVYLGLDGAKEPHIRTATFFDASLPSPLDTRGVSASGDSVSEAYARARVAGRVMTGMSSRGRRREFRPGDGTEHTWSYDVAFDLPAGPLFATPSPPPTVARAPAPSPSGIDPAKVAGATQAVTAFLADIKHGAYAEAYTRLAPAFQPPRTAEQFAAFAERCAPFRSNTTIEWGAARLAKTGAMEHISCQLATPAGRTWHAGFSFDWERDSLRIEYFSLSFSPQEGRLPSGLRVIPTDFRSETQFFEIHGMARRPINELFASYRLAFQQEVLGPDEQPVPGFARTWNSGPSALDVKRGPWHHTAGAQFARSKLSPGAYVLRVTVTDELRDEKLDADLKGFVNY